MSLLPDDHVYSFSQLQSFNECKYGFYLKRIEGIEEEQSNAFAERGSLIHNLLDEWAKGMLSKRDMMEAYESRYGNEVQSSWPRMLASKGYAQKAYQQGLDFLESFDEFEGYEILLAEEKYSSEILLPDGTTRPFVGIVDLIIRDESNGDLIICDHKSKSESAFKKAQDEMYMQMYMYSQFAKEKFGEFPKRLMFHLFNAGGIRPERPFDIKVYEDTMSWAGKTIQEIEDATMIDWLECKDIPEGKQDFYCVYLCGARKYCTNGKPALPKKNKEQDYYYENNS